MKLPSLQYILSNAGTTFKRFYLTIIAAAIGSVIGIYLTEYNSNLNIMMPYINLLLCMSIAIPLFFSATIISEKLGFNKKRIIFANLFIGIILVLIYFSLPGKEDTHTISLPYIKYAVYNIIAHLMVSFIPFLFNKHLNAFWHYNKILFIRICTSALYSGFIYVGLILALTSLDLLFDVKIHNELYIEIWIVVIGIFNTWFFVGGIPNNLDNLEYVTEYPKGLKIFSQYVLLPLLSLYLLILYAYGSKILTLWDWPKGIVSYLIIFVSVLGILTFLLIHPYGNQSESSWIKKASKGYYFLLFPLLIILFIAIFMRINDYGITINRYIILLLGVWLTIVCTYTALGKTNIKFIPVSLALILLLSSFGPWGMFTVSERSQTKRLKEILMQNNILSDGKILNETIWIQDSLPDLHSAVSNQNEGKLPDTLHNEVKSILDYLDTHHGFTSIRSWYQQDINSIVSSDTVRNKRKYAYDEAEMYMKSMGLKYEHFYANSENMYSRYSSIKSNLINISGYDYYINFNEYYYDDTKKNEICTFSIDSNSYTLYYSNVPDLKLSLKNLNTSLDFDLKNVVHTLVAHYGNNQQSDIPESEMQLQNSNEKLKFKIQIDAIEFLQDSTKKTFDLRNLSGSIFVKNNK